MRNKDLLHRCPVYTSIYPTMADYQMAYLGGTAFKRQARKKRPSEDEKIHVDVITHTVAQPICRYIVDSVNDLVFEPGIKRNVRFATSEGINLEPDTQDWSELFQLDADLCNRSLDSVMESIGQMTGIFGHAWVFVDMPKNYEGNLGRPYVCVINPIDVWDWKFEYYGGRQILQYVKVKEFEEHDCYYFKCYYLGDAATPSRWESYRVEKQDNAENDATLIDTGDFPAGMSIPGFIAFGRRDPRRNDVGVSDIDNASDAQREHYKLECEAYQSIMFAKTIIRADAGVKVPAHAGAIVRAIQGQIEAIKIDTADVAMIIEKQRSLLEELENLIGFGGLRMNRSAIQSGVSIIEERRTLHKVARSKARLMEVTEEMLWTFAARFMGVRWAGEVEYDTNYERSDTNYRLALMNQAKLLVPQNSVIDGLIAREVVAMLAPPEEVSEYQTMLIDLIDPKFAAADQEEMTELYTRDLGNQVPDKLEKEGPPGDDPTYSGIGTGIIYTGQSSYNPIADQLVGQASGR
jgi:hypothetical protein